jgi:hypothetical protein
MNAIVQGVVAEGALDKAQKDVALGIAKLK